jgi:hypothetical protein
MSTQDHPVAVLLGRVDGAVEPRFEFAAALLARLETELAAPAPKRRPVVRVPLRGLSPRMRIAAVAMLVLVLMVAVAVAARLTGRWLDAGPDGAQVRDDYRLVATIPGLGGLPIYERFALAPDGHDLYAIAEPDTNAGGGIASRPVMLVVHDVDTNAPTRSLHSLDLPDQRGAGWLSVAGDGHVFLGLEHSVVLLDSNGVSQPVVSLADLGIAREPSLQGGGIAVAATAPDRLWLRVEVGGSQSLRVDYGTYRFFEVTDPNADGNWSDRVVQPVVLPHSVPAQPQREGANIWKFQQLLTDPSGNGSTVLATALSSEGEYRVYQISDRNGDGDALDPGEVRVLFDRRVDTADGPWGPTIAAHVWRSHGNEHRQLVAAGLTALGRVSIIGTGGRVTDIARSFPSSHSLEGVLAGSDGSIYPIARVIPSDHAVVYRLQHVAAQPTAASHAGGPQPIWSAPVGSGAPRLAVVTTSGHSFTVGLDGRTQPLISQSVEKVCLSRDHRTLAFTSNAEAANEWFLYTARPGHPARKVSDRVDLTLICPPTRHWLLLAQGNALGTLIRHDLRTGRDVEIAHDVVSFEVSPDGRHVVSVGGLDLAHGWPFTGHETLNLLDVATGRLTRLAPPLAAGDSYGNASPGTFGLRWSSDGRRIAYVTGPRALTKYMSQNQQERYMLARPAQHYQLWIRDVATGNVLTRTALTGGPPSIRWSPDGRHLAVCLDQRTLFSACDGELQSHFTSLAPQAPGRLLLIDIPSGAPRQVATGRFGFADWAPAGQRFAYATRNGLYIAESAGGTPHKIASAPTGGWAPAGRAVSECRWLGWSPDGNFIALVRAGRLDVIDAATGQTHTLYQGAGNRTFTATWWQGRAAP